MLIHVFVKSIFSEQGHVAFSLPPLPHTLVEAENTVNSLNGRWFGGRVITAELYDQAKFDANDLSH